MLHILDNQVYNDKGLLDNHNKCNALSEWEKRLVHLTLQPVGLSRCEIESLITTNFTIMISHFVTLHVFVTSFFNFYVFRQTILRKVSEDKYVDTSGYCNVVVCLWLLWCLHAQPKVVDGILNCTFNCSYNRNRWSSQLYAHVFITVTYLPTGQTLLYTSTVNNRLSAATQISAALLINVF